MNIGLPPHLSALAEREPGADDGQIGQSVASLLAMELEPIQWLVPGYVQEQSIAILAGPPNSGKTLLAFDWSAKLAAKGKKVFLAQNEGGVRGLQQRLQRACVAANIPTPPGSFTYARNLDVKLSDLTKVRWLAKQLLLPDLIVLDSLASFWPGLNENDAEQMSLVAEALKILCEESQAAVIGIHHTTKAAWKPTEKPSLGDLRGHGAMAGRIDSAFICRPMDRQAGVVRFELHVVKQRDEDWTPPQAVEITMTGEAATLTSEPLQEKGFDEGAQREIEQQILCVVSDDETQAISGNVIATRVPKSKQTVGRAVFRLFERGLLHQNTKGRYYRPKARQPRDGGGSNRFGTGQRTFTRGRTEDD